MNDFNIDFKVTKITLIVAVIFEILILILLKLIGLFGNDLNLIAFIITLIAGYPLSLASVASWGLPGKDLLCENVKINKSEERNFYWCRTNRRIGDLNA